MPDPTDPAASIRDALDSGVQARLPRDLDCIQTGDTSTLPYLAAVSTENLNSYLESLSPAQAALLRQLGFRARQGQSAPIAEGGTLLGLAYGIGEDPSPQSVGGVVSALPPGSVWRLAEAPLHAGLARADLVLGFCLGAYRTDSHRSIPQDAAPVLRLSAAEQADPDIRHRLRVARAIWLARDLINEPANHLGPAELAAIARQTLVKAGAHANVIRNEHLAETYPTLHAVGAGSTRAPAALLAQWAAPGAGEDAPLISLCGKGICFDTGGYNLKSTSGMLRMKKDMGGAAVSLALALLIIESALPCRLELRIACAENMVSGTAMRPLDIVKTRAGLHVEIGNTDAEGRLALCDLLAEACGASPDFLFDFATLTGAARVALGPDVPALFCNDDALADAIVASGMSHNDPVWRLPLWRGYNSWLESAQADLNNVSEKPFAGAIIAALFLQRFVSGGVKWAHFDLYAWNDQARPGRPAGGEPQTLLAAFGALSGLLQAGASPDSA